MKILVSACLLGEKCRYDGESRPVEAVKNLQKEHTLIPFCPEQAGGLPTPRVPSEVQKDGSVKNRLGEDVTDAYRKGAELAFQTYCENGCDYAILKAKSPACGSGEIYDGSFTKRLCPGFGICAKYLLDRGITVFSEDTF